MAQTSKLVLREEIPSALEPALEALCDVAIRLSEVIGRGALGGELAAEVGDNSDGDRQKALDVMADEAFSAQLKGTGVRWYASEEQEVVNRIDEDGTLAIAIDPLDGSSNIDTNVSIGTIFGLQPALEDGEATFLRSGRELLASGYFIYGPQTALVVTFGDGVREFILDRADGVFRELEKRKTVVPGKAEFAINASNMRHWVKPVRAFIDDCLAGKEGPLGTNYNMRWIGSLVADANRILTRGGVFLYPSDARQGYEHGRLRLVYECAPMAFLMEQAGGRATTGTDPVLDRVPESLHARVPMIFGSADIVDRIITYFDLPDQEVSALFGNRGLFRN